MDLRTYISNLSVEARAAFADKCKTTPKHMQNVAYGYKPAGESLCINIERESGGQVTCETLRPDVDWNYLRGTQKLAA
jgi:DNA-binding transcriptional regulator YdaS (Cro superfamily)